MVNLHQKIIGNYYEKKSFESNTEKFDEVETRIIELENAIIEFSNSNLNTIEKIKLSINYLTNLLA